MLRIDCEALMWKITTRDFTLEEVLIMAGMNLLASADTATPTSIAATAHRTGQADFPHPDLGNRLPPP
jgi:hypothetical protein